MEIVESGIPLGYQQANCHNISHYISLLLESRGYSCAKIWAFAPIIYSVSSSKLISFTDKKNCLQTEKLIGVIMLLQYYKLKLEIKFVKW